MVVEPSTPRFSEGVYAYDRNLKQRHRKVVSIRDEGTMSRQSYANLTERSLLTGMNN